MVSSEPSKTPPSGKSGSGMTKLVVVIVAVIVIAAAGIGIYELTKSSKAPSGPKTPSTNVTITVWGSGSAGGEATAFNTSLAQFEAAYPNVTVQDSPAINVASTTFLTAAHAGTAPDVYRDTSDNGGAAYVAGAVLNLSKYLNKTYIDSFTSGTIADWTYNGALYGIPVNTNGIGLYYNKALVSTPPTNTYQMIQDAKNVTSKGGSFLGMPYTIGADSGYRFAAWIPAFGGVLFNSSFYPELNSPQDIAAMSFVWNWTALYHIDKTGLTFSDEQSLFEGGNSAFMLDGPWDQSTYAKALGSNLGVTAIPFDNATGLWPTPIWGSVGYLVSTPQASGITAAQTWASVKFVEFMTNNASQVNLFDLAGDFPALKSAGSYITNHTNNDPLIGGWLAQEQHTQIQPNYPQMAYYWPNFGVGASNLYANSTTVTVTDAMNQIETGIINDLKTNDLPYSQFSLVNMPGISSEAMYQSMYYAAPTNMKMP
ncbi:MAG: extracellular solute-binding protein [Thermoplasmataceae archaeon]|jgi:arabinogalactan oligomer/maltooligosaccharide transport system substrate-binding protein